MITQIGLENFRIFATKADFEFAPLTILTGANNSGKSSLLKAILLLIDNHKNGDLFQYLNFSSEEHKLGLFEYIPNHDSGSEIVSFSFDFDSINPHIFTEESYINAPKTAKWNYTLHYEPSVDKSEGVFKGLSIKSKDNTVSLFELECIDNDLFNLSVNWRFWYNYLINSMRSFTGLENYIYHQPKSISKNVNLNEIDTFQKIALDLFSWKYFDNIKYHSPEYKELLETLNQKHIAIEPFLGKPFSKEMEMSRIESKIKFHSQVIQNTQEGLDKFDAKEMELESLNTEDLLAKKVELEAQHQEFILKKEALKIEQQDRNIHIEELHEKQNQLYNEYHPAPKKQNKYQEPQSEWTEVTEEILEKKRKQRPILDWEKITREGAEREELYKAEEERLLVEYKEKVRDGNISEEMYQCQIRVNEIQHGIWHYEGLLADKAIPKEVRLKELQDQLETYQKYLVANELALSEAKLAFEKLSQEVKEKQEEINSATKLLDDFSMDTAPLLEVAKKVLERKLDKGIYQHKFSYKGELKNLFPQKTNENDILGLMGLLGPMAFWEASFFYRFIDTICLELHFDILNELGYDYNDKINLEWRPFIVPKLEDEKSLQINRICRENLMHYIDKQRPNLHHVQYNVLLSNIGLSIQNFNYLFLMENSLRNDFLIPLYKQIQTHFSSEYIAYLAPIKAQQLRVYNQQSYTTPFEQLIMEYKRIIGDHKSQRLAFIQKWVRAFDIGEDIIIKRSEEGGGNKVYLKKGKQLVNLADSGSGLSQLLPLILKLALFGNPLPHNQSNTSKLLLIEEPEINLHPNFQSKIADLLIDAHHSFQLRFVIETHSEYLIRRLQVLTAEGQLEKNQKDTQRITPDSTAIYYFNSQNKLSESGQQVQRIHILPNGRLDADFGEGFFDQATTLQIDLMKLKNQINP